MPCFCKHGNVWGLESLLLVLLGTCPAAFRGMGHAGLPYLRAHSRTLWSVTSLCFNHKLLKDLFPDEVAPAQPPSPTQVLPACLPNLCSFCNQALAGPVLERSSTQSGRRPGLVQLVQFHPYIN